jgi:Holliday junction DNA helicase RuvA
MIEYVKGTIAECTPTYAVIDIGGLGYMVNISLTTYETIKEQSEAKLIIHEAIREDAYNLYGFATHEERTFFRLLIAVSGVGASTARIILSSCTTGELKRAIMLDDVKTIKGIKGIGQKTAERIIVDLKDKMEGLEINDTPTENKSSAKDNKVREDALSALEVLGFQRSAARKVVDAIISETTDATVEMVVKNAIKKL